VVLSVSDEALFFFKYQCMSSSEVTYHINVLQWKMNLLVLLLQDLGFLCGHS